MGKKGTQRRLQTQLSGDTRASKGGRTNKNIKVAPAARIRRVVLDQPAKAADLIYSQASSIVMSEGEETMVATIMALRP